MKKLKFNAVLVPLILDGTKTVTWRLNDDKDLISGDDLEFINSDTLRCFAKARAIQVCEKKFGDLTAEDKSGHEGYISDEEMYKWFSKCYKQDVGQNTIVKIIKFKLARNTATWDDFEKIEIRVGKIIKVEDTEGLRISAYKMTIDFGEEIGQKISLGQYTANYTEETLEGRLVMCVINFEPKQIGSYISEALTLGFEDENGNAILAVPDKDVKIGQRLY